MIHQYNIDLATAKSETPTNQLTLEHTHMTFEGKAK